ncbi:MAG: phosphoribosylanthranilate isomerase [Deltaproteobacteria bacterium]|nr:phosphoribosylanthranilate isomerase [Deltaproteobacteria bacterium]
MTWIKICGITNAEDAFAAVDAGAHALGFVFYQASPRRIDAHKASAIIARLPESIEKIGVFVNQAPEQVSSVADQAGLTAIQLHGDEYQDRSALPAGRRILLAIPSAWLVKDGNGGAKMLMRVFTADNLLALVVDSGSKEQRGGTGSAFNWRSSAQAISQLEKRYAVVVAGGLTPDNVQEAIGVLHPWGVDVSSGVEASFGKKDPAKIRSFIQAVHVADQRNGKY